jgi:hypothetical protein
VVKAVYAWLVITLVNTVYTSYLSNGLITVAQSSILQVTAWSDVLVFLATDMAEALLELKSGLFIQVREVLYG